MVKKVELVARMQKIGDLAQFIPLFLHGAAFAVYYQLKEENKLEYEEMKRHLLSAFPLTDHQAFEAMKRRVLQEDETPDSFLADIKKLMGVIGTYDERIIVCQLVSGLPLEVSA